MAEWTSSGDKPGFRIDGEIGRIEDEIGPVEPQPMQTISVMARAKETDQGPCLYLGPEGQRCYRRAVEGGFCPAHQPGAAARARIGKRSKILAAIAGIVGALWPYIYDFVREMIRIFHPR